MNFELEKDFLYQMATLTALQVTRNDLENGTEAAVESDKEIANTKDLILSYETIKYYEKRLHRADSIYYPGMTMSAIEPAPTDCAGGRRDQWKDACSFIGLSFGGNRRP